MKIEELEKVIASKKHSANDHLPRPEHDALNSSMSGVCSVCGRRIVREDKRDPWEHDTRSVGMRW